MNRQIESYRVDSGKENNMIVRKTLLMAIGSLSTLSTLLTLKSINNSIYDNVDEMEKGTLAAYESVTDHETNEFSRR